MFEDFRKKGFNNLQLLTKRDARQIPQRVLTVGAVILELIDNIVDLKFPFNERFM